MASSEIWAISAYYNPARYRSRKRNFDRFRDNLNIPLAVVELAVDDPELAANDADIVIPLKSSAVLWHKECLLNIALSNLPPSAKYVAWLDCDILFDRKSWAKEAVALLGKFRLVQLFSQMYDLNNPLNPQSHERPSGRGIAFLVNNQISTREYFAPRNTGDLRKGLFGLAWCARREMIERHKFYDAFVVGSGDRALACAGWGRFKDAISTAHLNRKGEQQYLAWAAPFYRDVGGSIGFLDQKLFHLWHGDIAKRRYLERHFEFSKFDFDPGRHLNREQNGLLSWSPGTERIQQFVKNYFFQRDEDDGGI